MKEQKPSFEQFLNGLLETARERVPACDAATPWLSTGDGAVRAAILDEFKRRVEKQYGTELVVEPDLISLDRPLESIAVQLYHVFSTVHLMERINAKIRSRLH
ncbi:hypothetical protein [Desulfotomaculum copahuensis]|uniref:hypothetical protein n=1 Tax=Desulfotomaculum copahuensis TaxID=1838280 RepID=UPI00098F7D60|nr:hypothetical protein [Desulfotomaculum copahuensis]